jgi:hypothetical protein
VDSKFKKGGRFGRPFFMELKKSLKKSAGVLNLSSRLRDKPDNRNIRGFATRNKTPAKP